MWIRKRFDIGWSDLLHALLACVLPKPSAKQAIKQSLSCYGHAGIFLSVRSALDALLAELDLEEGDEVLMSALTVDGMVSVIEEHGLIPVPLDVETDTLVPRAETLRSAITTRSKILVVAHLFGNEQDISELLDIARNNDLLVIEDKAQAFCGIRSMKFNSDVVFYSFGLIKTATALGGGIAIARDAQTMRMMREIQSHHPVQSTTSYLSRVARYSLFKVLMYRTTFGSVVAILKLLGINFDNVVKKSGRGFRDEKLLEQLRHQPSPALVSVLHRRLTRYSTDTAVKHWQRAEGLRCQLKETCVVPGSNSTKRGYWVFPVLADDPEKTIEKLRNNGVDGSMQGSMIVVQPPSDRPQLTSSNARKLLEKIVFIPFYDAIPNKEIERIRELISDKPSRSSGDQKIEAH